MKLILLITLILANAIFAVNKPFPQSENFSGAIKPNNKTQTQLNSDVSSYYDYWKGEYLKESNGTTSGGGYYIKSHTTSGDAKKKTVSEAHGYGMIIFALMAGYDANAKIYFDGMYNMYDKHRSTIDHDLMSWVISNDELTSNDDDCATDGDMDIAYALILAHIQWGSDGAINYLQEAKRIITNGIEASLVDDLDRLRLGDWATDGEYLNATRPSDWMPDHLALYKSVTHDVVWDNVLDSIYSMTSQLQDHYSPNTGLLPDFVVGDTPKPSGPNFLEDKNDGNYNWNSCRVPWRLTVDYLHNGRTEAKTAVNRIISWVKTETGSDPSKIKAGYKLDGTALVSYGDLAFTAPMVVGATVDASNQSFLNDGWDVIRNNKGDGYFGETINMLSMLLISGNWWAPYVTDTTTHPPASSDYAVIDDFENSNGGINEQNNLGEIFGQQSGNSDAGSWFVYNDDNGSSVKNSGGTIITEGNENEIIPTSTNHLQVTLSTSGSTEKYPYAGIGCNLLEDSKYYNLTKLTAIKIRYKSSGVVRFSLVSKDIEPTEWGYYGYNLAKQNEWTTKIINVSQLEPSPDSPAADSNWTWSHGQDSVNQIQFDIETGKADISIDSIVFLGVNNATFGLNGTAVNSKLIEEQSKDLILVYPNPINLYANIKYSLKNREHVFVSVYDITGKLISTLEDGIKNKGTHIISWNTKNSFGKTTTKGIYFIKVKTDSFTSIKRVFKSK